MLRVVGFDLFGTLFQAQSVPAADRQQYLRVITAPDWTPFVWPASFELLEPFPDSFAGLRAIRAQGYAVAALTNFPLALTMQISRRAGLHWDAIVPFETQQIYKPAPQCYRFACELLGIRPDALLMISANKGFGDIEQAHRLGCGARLIRQTPEDDLLRLAEDLSTWPRTRTG